MLKGSCSFCSEPVMLRTSERRGALSSPFHFLRPFFGEIALVCICQCLAMSVSCGTSFSVWFGLDSSKMLLFSMLSLGGFLPEVAPLSLIIGSFALNRVCPPKETIETSGMSRSTWFWTFKIRLYVYLLETLWVYSGQPGLGSLQFWCHLLEKQPLLFEKVPL